MRGLVPPAWQSRRMFFPAFAQRPAGSQRSWHESTCCRSSAREAQRTGYAGAQLLPRNFHDHFASRLMVTISSERCYWPRKIRSISRRTASTHSSTYKRTASVFRRPTLDFAPSEPPRLPATAAGAFSRPPCHVRQGEDIVEARTGLGSVVSHVRQIQPSLNSFSQPYSLSGARDTRFFGTLDFGSSWLYSGINARRRGVEKSLMPARSRTKQLG